MTFEQLEIFEEWRSVVGHEGRYEVSNWGRVRSLARGRLSGRILNPWRNSVSGYLLVTLGHKEKHYVHELTATAFLGPRPVGKVVHHKNTDRTNNCVYNLRYLTEKEHRNTKDHPPAHFLWGEASHRCKYTDQQIAEMRNMAAEGYNTSQIAKHFGADWKWVANILKGKFRAKGSGRMTKE